MKKESFSRRWLSPVREIRRRLRPEKVIGPFLRLTRLTPDQIVGLSRYGVRGSTRVRFAKILYALGYHRSAVEMLRAEPLASYHRKYHHLIALFLAAIEPDDEAEVLVEAELDRVLKKPDVKRLRNLLNWYATRSVRPDPERLAAVERLAQAVKHVPHAPDRRSAEERLKVPVARAQIDVRRAAGEVVDIFDFLPWPPDGPEDALAYVPFVSELRLNGYSDKALAVAQAIEDIAPERYATTMLHNFPMLLDISQVTVPDSVDHCRTLLSAVAPVKNLSLEHKMLFDTLVARLIAAFPNENLVSRDRILKVLVHVDFHEEALCCVTAQNARENETLLSTRALRAWNTYYRGDFAVAAQAFKSILREAPKHADALVGYRYALSRSGASMAEILRLVTELCGTQPPDGEAVVWKLYEEGDTTELSRHYLEGRRWKALHAALGARFLKTWPTAPRKCETLFFVADQGVGDEIRTLRHYRELTRVFGKVHATCDPRLKRLLEFNFPDIEFHPVWRSRVGLIDRLSRMDRRIKGFNGTLYNSLTEDMRPLIDAADRVGTHHALGLSEHEAVLDMSRIEAIIRVPDPEPKVGPDGPLRVGLLWRSHLIRGERRLMYLSHESLVPILDTQGVEFHAVQHAMTQEEIDFCREHGVIVRDDIDMYDDFDAMARYLSSLDLIVGISSVPAELGAALGIPIWFLGFSPENLLIRSRGGTTEIDQLTRNAKVVAPRIVDFTRPPQTCMNDVLEVVRERLEELVAERRGSVLLHKLA